MALNIPQVARLDVSMKPETSGLSFFVIVIALEEASKIVPYPIK